MTRSDQSVTLALSDMSAPLPPRDILTLVMEDGRKLKFFNAGGGNFTVIGAIY